MPHLYWLTCMEAELQVLVHGPSLSVLWDQGQSQDRREQAPARGLVAHLQEALAS